MVNVRVLEIEDEERAFMLFEDGDEFGIYSGGTKSIRAIADSMKSPVVWLRCRGNALHHARRWFRVDGETLEETPLPEASDLYQMARVP